VRDTRDSVLAGTLRWATVGYGGLRWGPGRPATRSVLLGSDADALYTPYANMHTAIPTKGQAILRQLSVGWNGRSKVRCDVSEKRALRTRQPHTFPGYHPENVTVNGQTRIHLLPQAHGAAKQALPSQSLGPNTNKNAKRNE
jgi:hypothetical protein